MAGGWNAAPVYAIGQDLGSVLSTTRGISVISGVSNVKGSWTQIIASTVADITRLHVMVSAYGAAALELGFDFAVAAAGNEANGLLLQNLVVDRPGQAGTHIELPVQIKAGSRIAARSQSLTASDTPQIQLVGFNTGFSDSIVCNSYDTYGYSGSSTVTGLSVDPGATVDTKGAYTVMTASSTNNLQGFFLGYDTNANAPAAGSDAHTLLDVAIGAAGSEIVIVPNIQICKNNFSGGYALAPCFTPIFWLPIKAGTRIAIRSQSSSNTATDRLLHVSLYGLRA